MGRTFFALLAVSIVTVAICGGRLIAAPISVCSQDARIIPGERIGNVRIGMSVQEAITASILPRSGFPNVLPGDYVTARGASVDVYADGSYVATHLEFPPFVAYSGAQVIVLRARFVAAEKTGKKAPNGAELYVGRVQWLAADNDARCHTREGIHIGSSLTDVKQAYGAPSGIFGPLIQPARVMTVLAYDTGGLPRGILFAGSDDRVAEILVAPLTFCGDTLISACSGRFEWRADRVWVPRVGTVKLLTIGAAHEFDLSAGTAVTPASEFRAGETIHAYMTLELLSAGIGPDVAAGLVRWTAPSGEVLTERTQWNLKHDTNRILWGPQIPAYEGKVQSATGKWQVEFLVEGVSVAKTAFTLTP